MKNQEKMNMLKYFIAKILIGLLGMICLSLYSKMLKPDIYGIYSLLLGFINVSISIFIGWIGSSALRYYDAYKENKKIFISNLMIDWFFMTFLMIIIYVMASIIFPKLEIHTYLYYGIMIMIGLGLFEIFEKLLRASNLTNFYIIAIILQSFMNLILFYTLKKYVHLNLESIIFANIVSHFVFIILSIFALKLYKNIDIKLFSRQIQMQCVSYGFPMVGVWGISWLLSYSDRYIIALFYSKYQVGLYDMSYRLVENIVNLFIASFTLSIFPSLIKTWNEKGKKESFIMMQQVFRYFFVILMPIVTGLLAVREHIYVTVLDPKYAQAVIVYCFTAVGIFFMGINNILYKLWQLREKTHKILFFMIISVILNIGLNFIFVPLYGYQWAAITTFVSYFILTVIVVICAYFEFGFSFQYKVIVKCLICSIFMYIVVRMISNYIGSWLGLMIMVLVGVITYGLGIQLFGLLRDEIKWFRGFLKGVKK